MIQASSVASSDTNGKPLKGWHVLLIMLGFFGVIFAVNGVFLYHAITSFPGEDVKKSYVQGLNYNDTLAARAAQAELGWTAEAGLQNGDLIFRLQDAEGVPLSNLAVIGEIRRRATRDADQSVVFQANAAGEYVVPSAALEPGQWALRISVYDAAGETLLFNVDKTIIVS
ncbi:MAG: FixH family protein [Henriciella sp.]